MERWEERCLERKFEKVIIVGVGFWIRRKIGNRIKCKNSDGLILCFKLFEGF